MCFPVLSTIFLFCRCGNRVPRSGHCDSQPSDSAICWATFCTWGADTRAFGLKWNKWFILNSSSGQGWVWQGIIMLWKDVQAWHHLLWLVLMVINSNSDFFLSCWMSKMSKPRQHAGGGRCYRDSRGGAMPSLESRAKWPLYFLIWSLSYKNQFKIDLRWRPL